jgi:hypothetical protein
MCLIITQGVADDLVIINQKNGGSGYAGSPLGGRSVS